MNRSRDVTLIFLYCLNDANVAFLDSEMSTEQNDLLSRSSRAKVSARLELGRCQICTMSFFGVRDNSMTVYADVRVSFSNIRLLDQTISYEFVLTFNEPLSWNDIQTSSESSNP